MAQESPKPQDQSQPVSSNSHLLHGDAVAQSAALMAHLRSEQGCPWDREQNFDSIKPHTLEEVYEVFDAIDRRDWNALKDELGDLLLQVLFYAQMADEAGYFSLRDVAENLNAKLIRRHTHIFSDAVAETPEEVTRTWERVKEAEKGNRGQTAPTHYLDSVPNYLPALLEAEKLGKQAAKVGFDWPDTAGLFEKLAEESEELKVEIGRSSEFADGNQEAIGDELGDLFFTAVHLARHLRQHPEFVLRRANRKFHERFNRMEQLAGGAEALRNSEPAELDRMWRQIKQQQE